MTTKRTGGTGGTHTGDISGWSIKQITDAGTAIFGAADAVDKADKALQSLGVKLSSISGTIAKGTGFSDIQSIIQNMDTAFSSISLLLKASKNIPEFRRGKADDKAVGLKTSLDNLTRVFVLIAKTIDKMSKEVNTTWKGEQADLLSMIDQIPILTALLGTFIKSYNALVTMKIKVDKPGDFFTKIAEVEKIIPILKKIAPLYSEFAMSIQSMETVTINAGAAGNIAKNFAALINALKAVKTDEDMSATIASVESTFSAIWKAISKKGIKQAKQVLDELSALVLSLYNFNIPADAAGVISAKVQGLASILNVSREWAALSADTKIDTAKLTAIVSNINLLFQVMKSNAAQSGEGFSPESLKALEKFAVYLRTATEALATLGTVPPNAVAAAEAIAAFINAVLKLQKISSDADNKAMFKDLNSSFKSLVKTFSDPGIASATAQISGLMGAFASLANVPGVETKIGKILGTILRMVQGTSTESVSVIESTIKKIVAEAIAASKTVVNEADKAQKELKKTQDINIAPKRIMKLETTGLRLADSNVDEFRNVLNQLSSEAAKETHSQQQLSAGFKQLNNDISMNIKWRQALITSVDKEIDTQNLQLNMLTRIGQAESKESNNIKGWIADLAVLRNMNVEALNSLIALQTEVSNTGSKFKSMAQTIDKSENIFKVVKEDVLRLQARLSEMKAGKIIDVDSLKSAVSALRMVDSVMSTIGILQKQFLKDSKSVTPTMQDEFDKLNSIKLQFGAVRQEVLALVTGMKDFNAATQASIDKEEILSRIMAKEIMPLVTNKKSIWIGGGGGIPPGGGGGGPTGTTPDAPGEKEIATQTIKLMKLVETRIDAMEASKLHAMQMIKEAEAMRLSGVSMQANTDALNSAAREVDRRRVSLETLIPVLQRASQAGYFDAETLKVLTARMYESSNATGELGAMLKMQAASFKTFKDSARDAGEEIASTVAMQVRQFTSFTLLFGIMSTVRETFQKVVEETKYLGIALSASRSDVDSLDERLSILGETMDDMRSKFGKSSKEIGDALYQMGSAGLNMKDTLASIEPIMNLIVGTGAEANDIAKTMAATFNVLSYQGALTGNSLNDLGHIADVTAAIFRDNQIEIDEFTNALKYVLPIAHLVSVSFEELSAILGTLHNQGIKAGQAGRSLRSVFFSIAQNRRKFESAFADLGIKIDPTGPLKFMDILEQLGDKLGKGSVSVARLEKVVQSLNMRGTGPFLLLAQGAGLLKQNLALAKTQADGAASALANIKLNTLSSQIDKFNENIYLMMKSFIGPLIEMLTYLVKTFNKVAEAVRDFNDAFAIGDIGILDIFAGAIGTVLGLASAIAIARQSFLGLTGLILFLGDKMNGLVISSGLAAASLELEKVALDRNTVSTGVNDLATKALTSSKFNMVAAIEASAVAEASAATKAGLFASVMSSIKTQFIAVGGLMKSFAGIILSNPVTALVALAAGLSVVIGYLYSASRALSKAQEELAKSDQLLQDMASSVVEQTKFENTATALLNNYERYNRVLQDSSSSATEMATAQASLNNVLLQASQDTEVGFLISTDELGNLSLATDELKKLVEVRKELASIDAAAATSNYDEARIEQIDELRIRFRDATEEAKLYERQRLAYGGVRKGSVASSLLGLVKGYDIKKAQEFNKVITDIVFRVRKIDPTVAKEFADEFQKGALGINKSIDKAILAIKRMERELVSFGTVNIFQNLIDQGKEYKYVMEDLNTSIAETEDKLDELQSGAKTVDVPLYRIIAGEIVIEGGSGAHGMIERLRREYQDNPISIPVSFDDTLAKTSLLSLEHIDNVIRDMAESGKLDNEQLMRMAYLSEVVNKKMQALQGKLAMGEMPQAGEALDLLEFTSKWAEKVNEVRETLGMPLAMPWVAEFAEGRKEVSSTAESLNDILRNGEKQVKWAEGFARALRSAETPVFGALAPLRKDLSLVEDQLKAIAFSYTKQMMGKGGMAAAIAKGSNLRDVVKSMNIQHLAELFQAQADALAGNSAVAEELAGNFANLASSEEKAAGNKYMQEMEATVITLISQWASLSHEIDQTTTEHVVAMSRLTDEQRKVIAVGKHRGDQLTYELNLIDKELARMQEEARVTDSDYLKGIAYQQAIKKFDTDNLAKRQELASVTRDMNLSYMEAVGKLMEASEGQRTMSVVAKDMVLTYNKWYNVGQNMNELEKRHITMVEELRKGRILEKGEMKDIYSYKFDMMDMDKQRIEHAAEYLNLLREMRGAIEEINNLYKDFLSIQRDAIREMSSIYEERLGKTSDAFNKIMDSMAQAAPASFAIKSAIALGSIESAALDTSEAVQEMIEGLSGGGIAAKLMGTLFGGTIGNLSKMVIDFTNTLKKLRAEETELTKKMAAFDVNILRQLVGKGIDKMTFEDLGRAKESLSSLLGYAKDLAKVDQDAGLRMFAGLGKLAEKFAGITLQKRDMVMVQVNIDPKDFYRTLDEMTKEMIKFVEKVDGQHIGLNIYATGMEEFKVNIKAAAVAAMNEALAEMKLGPRLAASVPPGHKEGGKIPGAGNQDTVPAMLTPGEFVVRKDVAEKYMPELMALNNGGKGIMKFAEGGPVGDDRGVFWGKFDFLRKHENLYSSLDDNIHATWKKLNSPLDEFSRLEEKYGETKQYIDIKKMMSDASGNINDIIINPRMIPVLSESDMRQGWSPGSALALQGYGDFLNSEIPKREELSAQLGVLDKRLSEFISKTKTPGGFDFVTQEEDDLDIRRKWTTRYLDVMSKFTPVGWVDRLASAGSDASGISKEIDSIESERMEYADRVVQEAMPRSNLSLTQNPLDEFDVEFSQGESVCAVDDVIKQIRLKMVESIKQYNNNEDVLKKDWFATDLNYRSRYGAPPGFSGSYGISDYISYEKWADMVIDIINSAQIPYKESLMSCDFMDMRNRKWPGDIRRWYYKTNDKIYDMYNTLLKSVEGRKFLKKKSPTESFIDPEILKKYFTGDPWRYGKDTSPTGFQTGGVVPGSGKGDKVPALLEPGEIVLSNKQISEMGKDNIMKMLSGEHGILKYRKGTGTAVGYADDPYGIGKSAEKLSDVMQSLVTPVADLAKEMGLMEKRTGSSRDIAARSVKPSAITDLPRGGITAIEANQPEPPIRTYFKQFGKDMVDSGAALDKFVMDLIPVEKIARSIVSDIKREGELISTIPSEIAKSSVGEDLGREGGLLVAAVGTVNQGLLSLDVGVRDKFAMAGESIVGLADVVKTVNEGIVSLDSSLTKVAPITDVLSFKLKELEEYDFGVMGEAAVAITSSKDIYLEPIVEKLDPIATKLSDIVQSISAESNVGFTGNAFYNKENPVYKETGVAFKQEDIAKASDELTGMGISSAKVSEILDYLYEDFARTHDMQIEYAGDIDLINGKLENMTFEPLDLRGYATGGNVGGTDTIPAMLTKGEFIFPKGLVDAIGADNLQKVLDDYNSGKLSNVKSLRRGEISFFDYLNSLEDNQGNYRKAVREAGQAVGYARGGFVGGISHMADGGPVSGMGVGTLSLGDMIEEVDDFNKGMRDSVITIKSLIEDLGQLSIGAEELDQSIQSIIDYSKANPINVSKVEPTRYGGGVTVDQSIGDVASLEYLKKLPTATTDMIKETASVKGATIAVADATIAAAKAAVTVSAIQPKIDAISGRWQAPAAAEVDVIGGKRQEPVITPTVDTTEMLNDLDKVNKDMFSVNPNAAAEFEATWKKILNKSIIKPMFATFVKMRSAWNSEWYSMLDNTLPLIARFIPIIGQALIDGISGAVGGLVDVFSSVLGSVLDTSWIPFDDKIVEDTKDTMKDIADSYDDGLEALVKQLRRNEISYFEYLNRLEDLQGKYQDDVKAAEKEVVKENEKEDLFASRVDQIVQAIADGFSGIAGTFASTLTGAVTDALTEGARNSMSDIYGILTSTFTGAFSMLTDGVDFSSMFGNNKQKEEDKQTTGAAIFALADKAGVDIPDDAKNTKPTSLLEDISTISSGILGAISDLVGVAVGISTIVASFGGMLSALTVENVSTFFTGKQGGATGPDIPSIYQTIDGIITRFVTQIPKVVELIAQNAGPLIAKVLEAVKTIIPIIMDAAKSFIKVLMDNLPEIINVLKEAIGQIIDAVVEMMPQIADALGQLVGGILDIIIEKIIGNLAKIVDGLLQAVVKIVLAIVSRLGAIIGGIISQLPGIIVSIISAVVDIVVGIIEALPKIVEDIVNAIPKLIDGLFKAIPKLIDKFAEAIPRLVTAIISLIPKMVWSIIKMIPELIKSIIAGLPAIFKAIIDFLPNIVSNLLKWLSDGLKGIFGDSIIGKAFSGIMTVVKWVDKLSPQNIVKGISDWLGIGGSDKDEKKKKDTYQQVLAKRAGTTTFDLEAMKVILQKEGVGALSDRIKSLASMGQLTADQMAAYKELLKEKENEATGLAKLGIRVNTDQLTQLRDIASYLETVAANTSPEDQQKIYEEALATAPGVRQELLGRGMTKEQGGEVIDVRGQKMLWGTIGTGTISDETIAQMITTLQSLGVSNEQIQQTIKTFANSAFDLNLTAEQSQQAWEQMVAQAGQTGLTGDSLAAILDAGVKTQNVIAQLQKTGMNVDEGPLDLFLSEYQRLTQEYLKQGMDIEDARARAAAEAMNTSSEHWGQMVGERRDYLEDAASNARELGMADWANKYQGQADALAGITAELYNSVGELQGIYNDLVLLHKQTSAENQTAANQNQQTANSVDMGGYHRGGLVYAHRGLLAPDEVMAVLLSGEGVLNRGAMQNLGEQNFKLLNSGVSLEDIVAMSAKKYSDISSGATTGLPPVNNTTTINQDDSKTEINEINNKSEDNRVVVQFTNCRFERGTSANEIEKALVSKWRNRDGKLQGIIRNNMDNKTSRNN